uniref:NPHS1 adhesion molecule, nephrin n=1 Tax=Xiphophorus couchianus TaxID=32473 RepID=A0A3B5KVF8_9TELE
MSPGTHAQQAFRTEPRNLTVRMGATAVLKCEVLRASGIVQWAKDGFLLGPQRSLPGFPRYSMIGRRGQYNLRIEDAQLDDDAFFECQAGQSERSEAIVSNPAFLTVQIPPSKLYFTTDVTAPWVAGKKYMVECVAPDAKPGADITLYKGESLSSFPADFNLTTLTCQANNEAVFQPVVTTVTMNVYYPPEPPYIIGLDRDVVKAGSLLVLECVSHGGNPLGTLQWTKEGEVLSTTWGEQVVGQKSRNILRLKITPADNQAELSCESANIVSLSPQSITHKITVFSYPSMLVLVQSKRKITAKEEVFYRGQQMELQCLSGSSNPKSDISWKVGLLRFQGVAEAPKKAEFGGVSVLSRLHLNLTSQHHNQKVICQAYSPVLEEGTSTFYQLNVLYPPEFSSEQATEVQVVEDDVATIPLMVSANPEVVSCIWLRRKQMLVKGDPGLYDHSLEIRNVTRKDGGLYTIKCENGEGVNETTVKLDVYYAPTVKAEKDPVYVNQGGRADLICVADANPIIPEMFSWKWLGEEEVEMGEETNENKSSLLTIHNVTRAHAGFYQCTASNGIALPGSVEMKLLVQFTPELRKGPQWRKVASRGDGTATAELVCQAEGIPPVEFTWEKKGMLIDLANPRYEERTARDGSFHTSTLRVVNVSATLDYAVFSCTARNSLGEDKLDIQLVSTTHPDPPSSFSLVSVTHDSVTLEWIPGFNGGLQQRYRIRYIWDQSVSFMYVDVVPPDTTTFTVTGLQSQTTYSFSVNALNSIGESGYADDGAVLTITTEAPSGLSTHLTVAFTVVFGVLLVLNSLGCFFGRKWKNRRDKTSTHDYLFHLRMGKCSSLSCLCSVPISLAQDSKEITLSNDVIVSSAPPHCSVFLFLFVCPVSSPFAHHLSLYLAPHSSLKTVTSTLHSYLLSHWLASCPSSLSLPFCLFPFVHQPNHQVLLLSLSGFSFLQHLPLPSVFFLH